MPFFNVQEAVALVTGTNKTNGIGRAVVEALMQMALRKSTPLHDMLHNLMTLSQSIMVKLLP